MMFVEFGELWEGGFGFERFGWFDIEKVLIFLVFLVEVSEVGL